MGALALSRFHAATAKIHLSALVDQAPAAVIPNRCGHHWLVRIPVYLDGNIIDLGTYKLQVAEACSGLRYLFPLMSFGFLFALLYRGPVWHKCLLFLVTIPITMLMNSVRIGVIGYLVDRYGIEQAEGFLHFFEGWIIFIACVGILLLIALLLRRLPAADRPGGAMLDIETSGIGRQLMRLRDVAASRSLVTASLLVLAAGLSRHSSPAQAVSKPDRVRLAELPPNNRPNGSSARSLTLDPQVERVLAADDYILVDYQNPVSGQEVNFFAAYYHSLTSGGGDLFAGGVHPRRRLGGVGVEGSRDRFPNAVRRAS